MWPLEDPAIPPAKRCRKVHRRLVPDPDASLLTDVASFQAMVCGQFTPLQQRGARTAASLAEVDAPSSTGLAASGNSTRRWRLPPTGRRVGSRSVGDRHYSNRLERRERSSSTGPSPRNSSRAVAGRELATETGRPRNAIWLWQSSSVARPRSDTSFSPTTRPPCWPTSDCRRAAGASRSDPRGCEAPSCWLTS